MTEPNTTAQVRVGQEPDVWAFVERLAAQDAAGCAFWACPGPDEPVVPMATCHHCAAIRDARDLLTLVKEAPE